MKNDILNKSSKIYIAGHRGMVGSGITRKLVNEGFNNLITRSSNELDLTKQNEVNEFFEKEKPEFVFLAAAKVGGIHANNTYRAEFIYNNLMIEANLIHASYLFEVKKLLYLGSSCIYPKMAPQPLKEEYLLSDFLEKTNQPYAIAKIAGIELCDSYRAQYGCNFISVMPTNLYGTNDNYDPDNSHVLPALIRKIINAKLKKEKSVLIWGTGTPMREFLNVDDLADACLFLMKNYDSPGIINVGYGKDITINGLAQLIAKIVSYEGQFVFDKNKLDGTPRKLLDTTKINKLGWMPKINLEQGIKETIEEYLTSNDLIGV
jgi:GDP-L-fucose synthase